MSNDFSSVTEISGEQVSNAQIRRHAQRYYWAAEHCRGKDVLEIACGAGQGLGELLAVARSVRAGDITPALVERVSSHYGSRLPVSVMDAERLPFDAKSLDVVILFEAIYYLPSADRFIAECRRVLRDGGLILFATANCDLFDFNPSPYSVQYYGVANLGSLLSNHGFVPRFFGGSPVVEQGLANRAFRLAKKVAVTFNLIPGSMRGKRWLKRLVFGKLVPMPSEIPSGLPYQSPVPIDGTKPDSVHQVIYCEARLG